MAAANIPRLLEQSDQALRSIVGLKADEKERYDTLLTHVVAIRGVLDGDTVGAKWRKLKSIDRAVMGAFFNTFQAESDDQVDAGQLATVTGQPIDAVRASVRFLQEREWVIEHAYSGGGFAELSDAGVRFAWEATDPAGYSDAIERLTRCLPLDGESERIGAMAQRANVPYPFAQVLVTGWAEKGLVEFEDGYSPPEMGLVHSVTESFRRSIIGS